MHDFSMADVLREVEVLYLVGGHPSVVGLREVSVVQRLVAEAVVCRGVCAGSQASQNMPPASFAAY